MNKTLLLATAALALSAMNIGSAIAASRHVPTGSVLYSQNSNFGPGVPSNEFTTCCDSSLAADDFIVPTGPNWHVTEVDVTGVYASGGPAPSFNLGFDHTSRKRPVPGRAVRNGFFNYLSCTDNNGSLVCTLPSAVTLKPGRHYWF